MPKVSIVIPSYNRALLLMDAINSVLCQTWTDFELIVVDDGSTDETLQTLAKIRDPRLKVLKSAHQGAAAARNLGIKAAVGEYIAFLDSDDLFLPSKLAKFLALFASNPELVFVHSAWIQKTLPGNETCLREVLAEADARAAMLQFEAMALPCVMVKTRILQDLGGFREHLVLAEDRDLWCRLAASGPLGKIDEALTVVHYHASNTHKPANLVWQSNLDVITYFFAKMDTRGLKSFKYYLSHLHYLIIMDYLNEGNFWQALKHALYCPLVYPANIKYYPGLASRAVKKLDKIWFGSYFFGRSKACVK